jgi:beta-glucosidase/6-phospho-beta-glucosidase/beta-galactosidase
MRPFMFATGIENSYPTIALPDGSEKRIDEMEKCGFYRHWKEDFQLTLDLGIDHLRWGPPYYAVHTGPARYDWDFSDLCLQEMQRLGITPIVDLCHFGIPDWLGNFQNPEFPEFFAEYARAFADRYPWVKLYTPINEIYVAALFSARYGWWNERLKSERAFVTALRNMSRANVQAMWAILEETPQAIFIQSESSEYFHAEDPDAQDAADFLNERRFLSLDLSYGYRVNSTVYEYLMENGMTPADLRWFHENHVRWRCVMGNDYYVTNEHLVHVDGTTTGAGEIFGYYVITEQYFDRYHLPVMHTETNMWDPDAVRWLHKEWANVRRLRQDGVPVLGFTWFSLTDQVDWETALREDKGVLNPVGLYDLDRKIRPVGESYRKLIRDWSKILPEESTVLGMAI